MRIDVKSDQQGGVGLEGTAMKGIDGGELGQASGKGGWNHSIGAQHQGSGGDFVSGKRGEPVKPAPRGVTPHRVEARSAPARLVCCSGKRGA
jgi:hypothetical protein